MIIVLYSKISLHFQEQCFEHYLQRLPKVMQRQVMQYQKWQDQQARLLGKLLLQSGCKVLQYPFDPLEHIEYTRFKRPYVPGDIDFNISHAGEYVICAIAGGYRCGIDIEKHKNISLLDYKTHFTKKEWLHIHTAKDNTTSFFTIWTQKEAIIKGDGRGMYLPLSAVTIQNGISLIDDQPWYIYPVPIGQSYTCHLAIDNPVATSDITAKYIAY